MSRAFQTALEILRAEEQARQQPKPEPVEPPAKLKTEIYKWYDPKVTKRKVIVNVSGPGKLVKLRIVSPTSDFKLYMVLDGETIMEDSYTDLTDVLAAYEEDDVYYLHLEEKAFRKSLVIAVLVTETTTFTLLFAEVLVEE